MNDLYIDETFFKIYNPWSEEFQTVSSSDSKIFRDFWYLIEENKQFTKSQANLLCKLIQKYKKTFDASGFDVNNLLKNYKWKNSFREIDQTKKIYVETDNDGVIWICLKFPYSIKSKFDEHFSTSDDKLYAFWDDDAKVRKVNLYKVNFLHLLEFAKKNNLELDISVLDLADELDEIWQNKEHIEKTFLVKNNKILLSNASEYTLEYFNNNTNDVFEDNLLLAKELGYVCTSNLESKLFNKICCSENNLFWINNLEKFLDIYKSTTSKVCVILDRTSDYKLWIKNFIELFDLTGLDRSEVKVCFREDSKESDFNVWVKDNGLGGKVNTGRIHIFLSTPAKWLYKDIESYKIILVNSLFPYTNKNTQNLINYHSLVIYADEGKPSVSKDSKIEEL
jgi:hypothetical protein